MSLEVSHVSYVYRNRYQSVQAVKDVSYAFAYGKLTALVGKSGSGKSTLAGLIYRLHDTQEGTISIDGIISQIVSANVVSYTVGAPKLKPSSAAVCTA